MSYSGPHSVLSMLAGSRWSLALRGIVAGLFGPLALFFLPGVTLAALGILAGLLTFIWPAITALVLLHLTAFWAILTGIFEIVAAISLREIEWPLILSVIFGVILAVLTGVGLLSLVWLMFGAALIVLSFRVHGAHRGEGRRVA